jgi:hypothetical protein
VGIVVLGNLVAICLFERFIEYDVWQLVMLYRRYWFFVVGNALMTVQRRYMFFVACVAVSC